MSATTQKKFFSGVAVVGNFQGNWPQETIKNEPMFFNASLDFAIEHGGPITRDFISSLPSGWNEAVLDSRVHMLMPGWYPAIPGYHHDDIPRPIIPVGQHFVTAGQPDYDNPRYYTEHIMGLANGDICPTVFALGHCTMPAVSEGGLIYRQWHLEVEKLLTAKVMQHWECPSGKFVYFDWQTFHSGSKAKTNGWRWFCRITRNSERCKTITNEIRQQVQVYLEFPMEGW